MSDPLRSVPEPRVADWLDAQAPEALYFSAITVAALRFGVRALPVGRRRDRLHEDLKLQVLPMFAGRVAAYGGEMSEHENHSAMIDKALGVLEVDIALPAP